MGPIGVFDSGLGGLTVVRALYSELPDEPLVYLGDTARVPYGTKGPATILRYSRNAAGFLVRRGVKMLLVACNTASAHALDTLRAEITVPVLGAVEPGAEEAVRETRVGRVGVIGTLGTVRSGSYVRAIEARDPRVHVSALACPLLVPLAEEGWIGEAAPASDEQGRLEVAVAEAAARRYLIELRSLDAALDVIVLGCTHYPLLRGLLERVAGEVFGREVTLVDSARAMARAARAELAERGLLAPPSAPSPCAAFCVTDEARFDVVGARFLGHPLGSVERVDLI